MGIGGGGGGGSGRPRAVSLDRRMAVPEDPPPRRSRLWRCKADRDGGRVSWPARRVIYTGRGVGGRRGARDGLYQTDRQGRLDVRTPLRDISLCGGAGAGDLREAVARAIKL